MKKNDVSNGTFETAAIYTMCCASLVMGCVGIMSMVSEIKAKKSEPKKDDKSIVETTTSVGSVYDGFEVNNSLYYMKDSYTTKEGENKEYYYVSSNDNNGDECVSAVEDVYNDPIFLIQSTDTMEVFIVSQATIDELNAKKESTYYFLGYASKENSFKYETALDKEDMKEIIGTSRKLD